MCLHSTVSVSGSGRPSAAARGNILGFFLLGESSDMYVYAICFLWVIWKYWASKKDLNREKSLLVKCYWDNALLGVVSAHNTQVKIIETLFLAFERWRSWSSYLTSPGNHFIVTWSISGRYPGKACGCGYKYLTPGPENSIKCTGRKYLHLIPT